MNIKFIEDVFSSHKAHITSFCSNTAGPKVSLKA